VILYFDFFVARLTFPSPMTFIASKSAEGTEFSQSVAAEDKLTVDRFGSNHFTGAGLGITQDSTIVLFLR
jgi:hypothetical protein